MSGRVIYAPDALDDLEAIRRYTLENWGVDQAKLYIADVERFCRSIALGKAKVVAVNAKGHSYGMARCRNHRIFFSRAVDTEIIAILHERMDLVYRLEARL